MEKTSDCSSKEVALKTFFLGPQAENGEWLLSTVHRIFNRWFQWRASRFPKDGKAISSKDQVTEDFSRRRHLFEVSVDELLNRFEAETPQFSPRYIGHMFSETSLPALLGHLVTLLHNPNNVSGESSRAGLALEKEAITILGKMFGCKTGQAYGHFTSGGTVANFEAALRARDRMANNPSLKPVILVPQSRHYSWDKVVNFLGMSPDALWKVKLTKTGALSIEDLRLKLKQLYSENRVAMMVVSVAGTTELGAMDPIHEVCDLLAEYKNKGQNIWHHVDAAYGGFYCSMELTDRSLVPIEMEKALRSIPRATSVTVDPHKLGYVPYASGAFLTFQSNDYFRSGVHAPYLRFEEFTDPGPQTLEGSRSAAGAVATWMSAKCTGFNSEGYGLILKRTLLARKTMEDTLKKSIPQVQIVPFNGSNILCFFLASRGEALTSINAKTHQVIQNLNGDFFVSETRLDRNRYEELFLEFQQEIGFLVDDDGIDVVRLCLMNPFLSSKETETNFIREFALRLVAKGR